MSVDWWKPEVPSQNNLNKTQLNFLWWFCLTYYIHVVYIECWSVPIVITEIFKNMINSPV